MPKAEVAAEVAKAGLPEIFAATPVAELPDAPVVLPQARYLLGREQSYQELREPIYLKEPHITPGVRREPHPNRPRARARPRVR